MGDNGAGPSEPVKKTRRGKRGGGGVSLEAVASLLRETLVGCNFNPEAVDAAIKKATKSASVKTAIAAGAGAASHKAKSKKIRSAYQVYATVAMQGLKDAGEPNSGLTEVGNLWKRLPVSVRADIEQRLNAFKDVYNAKLGEDETGKAGSVHEELKAYERQHGMAPFKWKQLMREHANGAITAPEKVAAPKKLKVEGGGAAAAAALPAPEADRKKRKAGEEGGGERKHKDKKKSKHKHKEREGENDDY